MDWLACPLDKPCPLDWCQAGWALVCFAAGIVVGWQARARRRPSEKT